MTDEDKVGQLLLLAWIGTTAEEARPALAELRAGGIVFVQNATLSGEARTINAGLKQIASDAGLLPPLIGIDHEGGIVQRIKNVPNLGNNWDFAAGRPSELAACQRGMDHARVLADMGFSVNLAPVLDVNNNPANPVIGKRSYSDDPQVVARLGAAYLRGLQNSGIAAVGKHFPGHGNTSVDSHLGLPSLPQSVDQLEKIELVPFREAVKAGVAGIMSAHIVFPAVDPSGAPATLSRNVMTGLLRDRLGFRGLAVSDDMGAMKAITDNYAPGDAAVRAIKAGVDMIILSAELPQQRRARAGLLAAVQAGEITPERLDEAVRHVLQVKARFGVLSGGPAQGAQSGESCP
jgi:beta-N-acetylhexosaminidase